MVEETRQSSVLTADGKTLILESNPYLMLSEFQIIGMRLRAHYTFCKREIQTHS